MSGPAWKPPGYERVRLIIKSIDPAFVTLAHQGEAFYREEFDLLLDSHKPDLCHLSGNWAAQLSQHL